MTTDGDGDNGVYTVSTFFYYFQLTTNPGY